MPAAQTRLCPCQCLEALTRVFPGSQAPSRDVRRRTNEGYGAERLMKPLILITNDDGTSSPGLAAAAEAVCDLGDLLIVAPLLQQTAMSRSYPKAPDIGVIERVSVGYWD